MLIVDVLRPMDHEVTVCVYELNVMHNLGWSKFLLATRREHVSMMAKFTQYFSNMMETALFGSSAQKRHWFAPTYFALPIALEEEIVSFVPSQLSALPNHWADVSVIPPLIILVAVSIPSLHFLTCTVMMIPAILIMPTKHYF